MDVQVPGDVLRSLIDSLREVTERSRSRTQSGLVLLASTESELRVTAFDGEIALQAFYPASVTTEGAAWVAAGALRRATQGRLDRLVRLRVVSKYQVSVSDDSPRRDDHLVCQPGKAGRPVPRWEGPITGRLSATGLERKGEVIVATASRDSERDGLYGVHLEVVGSAGDERAVRFVSTDGHRLAWRSAELHGQLDVPQDRVLPTPLLADLGRLGSAWIDVGLSESLFTAATTTHRVVSKLREGSFPNYRLILPDYRGCPSVTVDKDAFLAMVERVAAIGGDRRRGLAVALRADLDEQGLGRLAGAVVQEGVGEARDEVVADVEQVFEVGVLLWYLREAIGQVDAKRVRIDYAGPKLPLRFGAGNPSDRSSAYYLMPRDLDPDPPPTVDGGAS